MPSDPKHWTDITLEIKKLSQQQVHATRTATFVGWNADERFAFYERAKRLVKLRRELLKMSTGFLLLSVGLAGL